jgi:thymidylate synthase
MIPPNIFIEGYTLSDAWAKAVKEVMEKGLILPTEYGPRSRDVCSTIVIKYPFEQPMLHPQFPTKELHLREYVKQFTREYDWEKQGFSYTYVNRLIEYPIYKPKETVEDYDLITTDQLFYIKCELQKPITRRAQAITWVPGLDMGNPEPCCLQRIWMRKLTDSTCELHCDWRSRDLFSAWNSNYVGILDMIRREILIPLNLKLVKLVDFVDALHIYSTDWEEAEKVMPAVVNPQLMR